ncbi:alpha/beta hydrolase [Streptomyces sp. NPDC001404]|uniref:alpha/beta hydrolase n=1 Tax=Streptomyces sp. NPDC001404 TaxID=3364571 RepID=UPI0036C7A0CA
MSPRIRRLRRGLLTIVSALSLTAPLTSADSDWTVQAPVPPTGPAITTGTLGAHYAANRANIAAAAAAAAAHGHVQRARTLDTMSARQRTFFAFDARRGTAVEVFGDLKTARRIAVLVPGANTSLVSFGSGHHGQYKLLGGGARALYEEMRRQQPGTATAVVAWLGYHTPTSFSTALLTAGRAETGARDLRSFVSDLTNFTPSARISLLCHSYGSVVCGRSAKGLPVADIVFYASPGTGATHVSELRTEARIWAGVGSDDWITRVPNSRISLFNTTIGFGADPVSKEFGARRFDVGRATHSTYLRPGSIALTSLAQIATGRIPSTHY